MPGSNVRVSEENYTVQGEYTHALQPWPWITEDQKNGEKNNFLFHISSDSKDSFCFE